MELTPIVTFLLEQGGLAILAGALLWYARMIDKRNVDLTQNLSDIQREASAHVEKLYQNRLEAEGRINTALNEASQTMEALADVTTELKNAVQSQSEQIRELKAVSTANQEIGRDLKHFMSVRRD